MSRRPARASAGFTLLEMIIVVFLLALAMLGILAVFDASARINKSESEAADAQGGVRFSIGNMSSAIRMAGSGGLFVTQAVVNHNDPQLAAIGGITVVNSGDANSYDNVEDGTTVTGLDGPHPVRPNTDMIEIRGVLNSPMIAFDRTAGNGCGTCASSVPLTALAVTTEKHVNEDATDRPQFQAIDAYTAGASAANPMFVIVSQNDDLHSACSSPSAVNNAPQPEYAQPTYNVGAITSPTQLVASQTFGTVNFADATAEEFNNEFPSSSGTSPIPLTYWLRHAGVMDDIVYFVDNTDPNHPALAQGTRRGRAFDVVVLADDVENMQIAYGVDTDSNETVNRLTGASAPNDPDQNVSNQPGGDEWVPNVAGSDNPVTGNNLPLNETNFVANPGGALSSHCVRLHGVMVSIVARSKSSDPTYRAPIAAGLTLMNAPTPTPGALPYRRRVQTLKINLRNYAYQE